MLRPVVLAVVLAMAACAARPAQPVETASATDTAMEPRIETAETATVTPAESLLELVARVIEATAPAQRRSIEEAEKARFRQTPSYDNLLRLTMVRAYSAALPSELQETRDDLRALTNGRWELSDSERYLALMALIMVDQRLQMGGQIADLQRQIDSLTEIEASLKDNDVDTAPEVSP